MARRQTEFQTIRSEGGLLPADLLQRILDTKEPLPGANPEDYGLPRSERINEVITQSWNRLRKHWLEFRAATAALPGSDPATGATNDKWSLPLLRELGFGPLPTSAGPDIGGRTYAIARFVGPVPVHLVGCGVDLDRRAAGVRGAAAANPHGLVQEFVNRSPGHLWAIVSNGLRLRVLRDNHALSRQSFLEFDVEAMFAGEVYSDFVLLWLTAHATRFAPRAGGRPETCWLEEWTKEADKRGARVLGDLRVGVERALQILGEGFSSHPRNASLREALRSGQVPLADFHGQLLRVVYRLIFLFVAEDRILEGQSLLHPRGDSPEARAARQRYSNFYSTGRLRELAGKIKGSRHADLWRQFQITLAALSGEESSAPVRSSLALPPLGSLLWNPSSTAALNDAQLTNYDLLEALRHLAFTRPDKVLRPVNYRHLGAEELGGIYESLLALTPQISEDGARFSFAEFAGNERKTSGSYYTPDSLVQCLLDSALEPVVQAAIEGKSGVAAERALLALKVCDPAVGSGHFLVGAAHRLGRHLARVRATMQGETEPSPLDYQQALRDVIGRCLYGVDLNPMAAELCRVSLWLEALEPGKPLSFLDHHIRVGNSLLGATPDLISDGIPDGAFAPIEGDDKKACGVLRKRNKAERKGAGPLFVEQEAELQEALQRAASALVDLPDGRPEDIRAKELAFRRHEGTKEYKHKKHLADAWCAAFVIRKYYEEPGRESSVVGITQRQLDRTAQDQAAPALLDEVGELAREYQFFHWHLSFPEVFAAGGFSCVLGNPPWERIKLQEKEWFAQRRPDIARADSSARRRMIAALSTEAPTLHRAWMSASRKAEGESHFIRDSGGYPLCGHGDVNTYAVFAETNLRLVERSGRVGCIVPSGIATDNTTRMFFQDLVERRSLVSFLEFENRGFFAGAGHGHMVRFSLLTILGRGGHSSVARFLMQGQELSELENEERQFELSREDIILLNPNTRTAPIFRTVQDARLAKAIYRRVPVLVREAGTPSNEWGVFYLRLVHYGDHAEKLLAVDQALEAGYVRDGWEWVRPADGSTLLAVYESKMVGQFDHLFATYLRNGDVAAVEADAKRDPKISATPRYLVGREFFDELMVKYGEYRKGWFLGYRDVTDARASVRSVIATAFPRMPASIKLPVLGVDSAAPAHLLLANLNSFVLDFAARQKIGGLSLSFFILKQLPILPPPVYARACAWDPAVTYAQWFKPRVLELLFTNWALRAVAEELEYTAPPFLWDEERRALLRCELDAAFFHMYLPSTPSGSWSPADKEEAREMAALMETFPTPRDAVSYIMESFPIVRRRDEEKYGDYRTKLQILSVYDQMQHATSTNASYQSLLEPPPADEGMTHSPSTRPIAVRTES